MISAFGRNGEGSRSQRLYEQFFGGDARRCEPGRDTYLIVMSSCDHCGHSEYAQTLWYTDVAAVGLRHVPHLVAAANDCLPRRGELLRSLRLIEQFEAERKERRHRNDDAMWNALLSGCRLHNDREMTLGVFAEIRRRRFSERTMAKAAVSMRNLWAFQMKEESDGGLLDGGGVMATAASKRSAPRFGTAAGTVSKRPLSPTSRSSANRTPFMRGTAI